MSAGKLLVIDDDRDYRDSVRSLLESDGFTVLEASSGDEGLRLLVEDPPDAIVLDIMMRCCCEGYGVTQAIKFRDEYASCRDIPIIMASSIEQSPDELFPMAGEVGMIRPDYYVTKPLDLARFLEVVRRAVGKS
jgi:CheY-like chemotaxis protein